LENKEVMEKTTETVVDKKPVNKKPGNKKKFNKKKRFDKKQDEFDRGGS